MAAPEPKSRRVALGQLASLNPAWRVQGGHDALIAGITCNSKRVHPGDLFVALPGGYFDGHDFAADAVANGATALVVERPLALGVPELLVNDTRAALAPIAAEFYGRPSEKMRVVGITGTDGKTTTSYLLDAILRDSGIRTGLIGTISVQIDGNVVEDETRQTTPESLDVQRHLAAMLDAGVQTPIIEATSHGLDLHRLDCVCFVAGGVTNITHEHLEHHKTIAAYRRAKARLFENIAAHRGAAVVNLDDEGAREMMHWARGATLTTYSLERDADLRADSIELSVNGSRFTVEHLDERRSFRLPMLGAYNVANALCATGLAIALGVNLGQIVESLERAPAVPGRMERVERGQPFAVIVDYAHTPESLTKVMTLLKDLNPLGRLIVVCGSAGERDVAKRPMQGAVCADLADFSVFTTEDPRLDDPDEIIDQIADGAKQRGKREGVDFARITDRMEAIRTAFGRARPGDVVLLAGKGHERSIIWGLEKRPWDEPAAARQALAELGFERVE